MNVVKIEVNQLEKELHKECRLSKRLQKTREEIQKKERDLNNSIMQKHDRIHKLNQLIYN